MILDIIKDLFRNTNVEEERQSKYKRVFGTPEGKEVLQDILHSSGVARSSYVLQDPQATSFNEGRRSVGLRLLQIMEGNAKSQHNIEEI